MRRAYWSLLIGLLVVIVGLMLGVAGLFLLPIFGVFLILGIVFWLAERKARHKPPVE
ncbi:MAG: hypothetical protein ACLFRX_06270 [Gemmatimonadota bacterium]